MSLKKFLGKWTLIPEKCSYQLGQPPQSATYEIIQDGRQLSFLMDWVDHTGAHQQMSFSEICDGDFHPYEGIDTVDEIQLSLLEGPNLQSLAKKNGKIIMTASRQLISANLLKVTMGGPLPDGDAYTNISFYEK